MGETDTLIEVKNLKVQFDVRDGIVKAVDGANFIIKRGQTLGIIGESGCGKSMTAKAIMNMVPKPGKIVEGEIIYHRKLGGNGVSEHIEKVKINELDPDGDEIRRIRGGEIAMIFQEPMSSLTPVFSAGTHIREAVSLHRLIPIKKLGTQMEDAIQQYRKVTKQEAREIAIDMLQKVGIPKPHERVDSYPHQLSGGQRADEPTTALDVSIEAQILDLMRELQETVDMTILFITHNLGVVAEMADEICVMYMGKIVERADVVSVFYEPKHPYTQALLQSIPKIGKKKIEGRLASIEGMVPDPFELPPGCLFHPRCPQFKPGICDKSDPAWTKLGEQQWVSCFLYQDGRAGEW